MAPFYLTLPLLLLYPVVLVRLLPSSPRAATLDWLMLAVAIALDLLLLTSAATQEQAYFRKAWKLAAGLVVGWSFMWLSWQACAVALLVKRSSRYTHS